MRYKKLCGEPAAPAASFIPMAQWRIAMVQPHLIHEHMEVVGCDGVHVGTVDHMEGADQMKLTKTDEAAGGEHHFIPLAWVDHVDAKVHLKQSGAEAKARWKTH
jgi:hypothetical protein